ncbi:MAG: FTR1 family protein [Rhodospirillales bacterium]|nr:FTR1 family protein [Rhodospirillales bacterium]
MLAALVIVFREAIEAGLIVGIVLAASRGVAGRGRVIALGIAGGLAGAALVAAFAGAIAGTFSGSGQELLNAVILSLAVLMLTWHVVWMARHGRAMAGEVRAVGEAVRGGQRDVSALGLVVGIAVLREGAEVVLFLYGIAIGGGSGWPAMLAGGLAGVALGGVVSALLYGGLLALPTRHLFSVTNALVTFLAAGLAGQAAVFLQRGGFVDALPGTVWNSVHLLPESSLPGRVLHTLIGYSDRPSGLQLVVYLVTLAAILALGRLSRPAPPSAGPDPRARAATPARG